MTTNEAAERLTFWMQDTAAESFSDGHGWEKGKQLLDDALAAAKREGAREAVERVRAEFSLRRDAMHTTAHRIDYDRYCMDCPDEADVLNRILDEEAAR